MQFFMQMQFTRLCLGFACDDGPLSTSPGPSLGDPSSRDSSLAFCQILEMCSCFFNCRFFEPETSHINWNPCFKGHVLAAPWYCGSDD